jgi:diacylglycerol kinase (ATP)
MLWAGVGADGFLVDQLEPRPKWTKRIGPLSYVIQGLPVMLRLPPMGAVVTVDGQTFTDDYLLVLISNSRRYVGGMLTLSPQALLDDGLFEVWLFRGRGVWRIAHYLAQAKWADVRQNSNVTRLSARHITIHTTPPFPFQTDGDPVGVTPFSVEMRPGALHLLVPGTAPQDLFSQPGVPLAEWEEKVVSEL